jgi:phosphate transport system permease protein
VAGHADGSLEIWFPLRSEEGEGRQLTLIREFPRHEGAIIEIAPSWRNKGFLVADASGGLGYYHSTSHRTLWRGQSPAEEPDQLLFAPKGDAALISADDGLHLLDVAAPHPDISLKSLFAKVWYESYPEPAFVWQSSSATDDFEPKLSLVPLLIGTLKGTFYSMLLAIPLGIFGAMYTSQFLQPGLKKIVKPTVEIMAALPSVVLGFLAGLWLAPRLEQSFSFLVLLLVVVPLSVVLTGIAWFWVPQRLRNKAPTGAELLLYTAVIAGVGAACLALAEPAESWLFDGSFPRWLLETTGTPYDQRNAIVVGLAMGFAVIPIIFSVSEDAFSNVPRDLVAGSLALGANRWQTVTRVVLPTASPGIFSAIMIGFGRAVGETMIVLMATGNTPIMDWNPFNGFRTLSANIAVEIPEAPVGGTLYRTLFLSALLLFVLTFLVNTVAEIVRHRLRRRYANL